MLNAKFYYHILYLSIIITIYFSVHNINNNHINHYHVKKLRRNS